MTTLDALDNVPQFPGGPWANHAIYGTLLGLALALVCQALSWLLSGGVDWRFSWGFAAGVVTLVSIAKKAEDYFILGPSQGETALSCIGKAVLTPLSTVAIWRLVGVQA